MNTELWDKYIDAMRREFKTRQAKIQAEGWLREADAVYFEARLGMDRAKFKLLMSAELEAVPDASFREFEDIKDGGAVQLPPELKPDGRLVAGETVLLSDGVTRVT